MEGMKERFTITIEEEGLVIRGGDGSRMQFAAVEALMLLDILKHEEERLKKMAQDASPISMSI
jgi:hypothetical protein